MLKPLPFDKGLYLNVGAEKLSGSENAARLLNLLVDESGANVDRPALADFGELSSLKVIGAFADPEVSEDFAIFVTNDRKIYQMDEDGNVTDITGSSVLGGTLRPKFASDGTYIAIAGGGAPQRWNGSGVCELMPGSPPEAQDISFLDNYWVLLKTDTRDHYFAGPTPAARETWTTGTDFFSKESSSGLSKAQLVIDRELWIVGSNGYETWQNVGTSPVPFARSFAHKCGIVAPHTLLEADNTAWWFDNKRRFVRLEGRTPVEKSLPLKNTLKGFSTVSDAWASRIDIGGFQLILLAFPTEERIFVYDYAGDRWYEWNGYRDGQEIYSPAHCHVFNEAWNKHLVGGVYSGVISELTFDAKADGEDVLRRVRESGWYDHGTGKKKVSRFYVFHVKRGVGTRVDDDTPEPVFEVQVNDDGQGWTDPVQVSLGFTGAPSDPIQVHDLGGIYSKRKIRITCTDEVAFELLKIEEEVELVQGHFSTGGT